MRFSTILAFLYPRIIFELIQKQEGLYILADREVRTKTMARPFNTFALKLQVHCKYCARELEKELLNIKGVRSVKINQELGKVIISGKVDPGKILTKFQKVGREAELWCEQERPLKDVNALSKVIDPLNDPDIMTQLERFSDDPSVKSVEVTKTIKVIFKGESRNGPSEKIVEINTTTKNVKETHDQVFPHDHCDHSHGGGLCGASSSCCGGHSAISHNLNHGCCQYGNTTSLGPCCAHGRNSCYYHSQYGNNPNSGPCCAHSRNSCYNYYGQYGNTGYGSCYPNSISPSAGTIWTNDNIPSAPPLPDDYYQVPSSLAMPNDYYQGPPPFSTMPDEYYQAAPSLAIPHPYYSFLNENKNGCIIL
ncbi:uncharacterized protein LOC125819695 [Solanum verrucosum]|uniref:uncharacterized protein LOC125819695 n=1 Tax=Solanum verrucosum TaxID=315347 RepID=UPI0020D1DBEC|nr:uncharacterized protein LOC125819695 [Solanum verrucosum]